MQELWIGAVKIGHEAEGRVLQASQPGIVGCTRLAASYGESVMYSSLLVLEKTEKASAGLTLVPPSSL